MGDRNIWTFLQTLLFKETVLVPLTWLLLPTRITGDRKPRASIDPTNCSVCGQGVTSALQPFISTKQREMVYVEQAGRGGLGVRQEVRAASSSLVKQNGFVPSREQLCWPELLLIFCHTFLIRRAQCGFAWTSNRVRKPSGRAVPVYTWAFTIKDLDAGLVRWIFKVHSLLKSIAQQKYFIFWD